MFANEIQARQDFTAANQKLEAALAAFATARKRLHAITGEFVGVDAKTTLQFTTDEGTPASAEVRLTDC